MYSEIVSDFVVPVVGGGHDGGDGGGIFLSKYFRQNGICDEEVRLCTCNKEVSALVVDTRQVKNVHWHAFKDTCEQSLINIRIT